MKPKDLNYIFGEQPPQNHAEFQKTCEDIDLLANLKSHFYDFCTAQDKYREMDEECKKKRVEIKQIEDGGSSKKRSLPPNRFRSANDVLRDSDSGDGATPKKKKQV